MHTIILAAGNGSRLEGIVPTGLKPLLVVNGEPLIKRLVDQVRRAKIGNAITVVVSPTNAAPICELLGEEHRYVVQPSPRGPGDALLRGLRGWDDCRCMVLMGDNWFADEVIPAMVDIDADFVIGGHEEVDRERAAQFTRVKADVEPWLFNEGTVPRGQGPWHVWCGPLIAPEDRLHQMLLAVGSGAAELKIGPHLNALDVETRRFVYVDAKDIGTPEAVV